MNLRAGFTFWLIKNGLPFDYPKLEHITTHDWRILVGGRDEQFYNPKKRDSLILKKTKYLVKDFNKVFPEIDFKPEFNWAGFRFNS